MIFPFSLPENIPMLKMLSAVLLSALAMPALAQVKTGIKPPAPKTVTAAPNTAMHKKTDLRFRSTWGIYLSDTLPRTELLKLLDTDLSVRDQKNNKYEVISFEFTYEQKTPYVNDSTNKPSVYTEYLGDNFKTSKLSPLWSNKLKESLLRGEVLFFTNIIVKFPPDKFYKVPDLRFVVR